jgi:tetratricopeptide (TPR) repeat protein
MDRKLGNQMGIGRTLYQMAVVCQAREERNEALRLYDEAKEIFKKTGDKGYLTYTLQQIATIHQINDDYDGALKSCNEAKKGFEKLGDQKGIANTLFQIVSLYKQKNDFVKAHEKTKEAILALKKFGYLFSWDEIPGNDSETFIDFLAKKYGLYWVKKANIDKSDDGKNINVTDEKKSISLNLNNEKTEVNLKIDDDRADKLIVMKEKGKLNIYKLGMKPDIINAEAMLREIAKMLYQMAMGYQKNGEYDEALKLFSRANESFERLSDQDDNARTLYQIASLYKHKNDFSKARESLIEAIPILKKLGNKPDIENAEAMLQEIAKMLYQMAMACQNRGENDKALNLYKEAEESFEKLRDKKCRADTLLRIASSYKQKSDFLKAKEFIKEAISILERIGDINDISRAKKQLNEIPEKGDTYG